MVTPTQDSLPSAEISPESEHNLSEMRKCFYWEPSLWCHCCKKLYSEKINKRGRGWPIFKKKYHPRCPQIHKLTTLAKYFDIFYEHAHDALSDSLTLKSVSKKLLSVHDTTFREIFKESCRPFSDYVNQVLYHHWIRKLKRQKKPQKKPQKNIKSTKHESENPIHFSYPKKSNQKYQQKLYKN